MLRVEQKRNTRRLLAIAGIGALLCVGAFGYRMFGKKSLVGDWRGYSYDLIDGKYVPDPMFGDFAIALSGDGTYYENNNQTSGLWTEKDHRITLKPIKFRDRTAEENLKRYRKKDGSESNTIKHLIKTHMKTMYATYRPWDDRLILEDSALHFEFTRK